MTCPVRHIGCIFSLLLLGCVFLHAADYTISVNSKGCTKPSTRKYAEETQLTLIAEPLPGYHFLKWSDGNTDNPRLITVTKTAAFVANYEQDPVVYDRIVATATAGGHVEGAGEVVHGEQVSLLPVADEGYRFSRWTDGTTESPRVFTTNGDAEFRAIFVPSAFSVPISDIFHEVYIGIDGCDNDISQSFVEGATLTVTAMSNKKSTFLMWSDGVEDNPRTIVVDDDILIIAMFDDLPPVYHTITILPAQGGSSTGAGTYEEDETAFLEAVADADYQFFAWSDGNTDNPRAVVVDADYSFTPIFKAATPRTTMYEVSISVDGCTPSVGSYQEGTVLTLYPAALDGYVFTQWSDGNADNPRIISVTTDATFEAQFVESATPTPLPSVADSPWYDVSVSSDGCDTPVTQQFVDGTTLVLEAVPSEEDCYRFVRWSDGNTDNPRTVTITGDATYTATFEKVQYTITTAPDDATHGSTEAVEKQ